MSRKVQCDQFRQEHYVPVRPVRCILSVYVASRAERSEHNGLGCAVKDLFSGEETNLKLSALTKMGVRYPNGKRVKAYTLREGETYTMLGTPKQAQHGVFIVPKGSQYEYEYEGQVLPPGSCIVWDGKKSRVIGYKLFRKLFIMSPNPVSAGVLKASGQVLSGAGQQNHNGAGQQNHNGAGQQNHNGAGQQNHNGAVQHPFSGGVQSTPQAQAVSRQPTGYENFEKLGQKQAHNQTQHITQDKYTAIGRVMRNGEMVGLVITDGTRQASVTVAQCMAYAEVGKMLNVKAVNRNGLKFLSGNGMSLESLPFIRV